MTITKYFVDVNKLKDNDSEKMYYYNDPFPNLGKGRMDKLLKKGRIRAEIKPIPLIKVRKLKKKYEVPKLQLSKKIIQEIKQLMARKKKREITIPKQDYGQLLIFMAIVVGMPRWIGAMMGADGVFITGWLDDMFKLLYGISGLGMAVLEVLAIGYIFAGLRGQPVFNGKIPNVKFWGAGFFGILILALIPLILVPFMLAQLNGQELSIALLEMQIQWQWITAVVLAPLIIIGGVAFTRAGIMDLEVPETTKERALRLRREREQRQRDEKKATKKVEGIKDF